MKTETEVPVPQLDESATIDLPPLDSVAAPEPTTTEAPKKRRRRRKQQPEPTPQPEAEPVSAEEANFAQALAMGFDFGGRIAAGMRGDHWRFTAEEVNTLGAVWAKALHPYMGRLAPYTPFIVATVVTAGVMMPKIQQDRLLRAEPINARRLPLAAVDGPSPAAVTETIATTRDDGAWKPDHIIAPELEPPEPQPDTLGGAAAQRRRRRNQNPPGIE